MRVLIFIQPWHWGHFLQLGNVFIVHWKAGDAYTWDKETYHLAGNAGIKSRYIITITGFSDQLPKY